MNRNNGSSTDNGRSTDTAFNFYMQKSYRNKVYKVAQNLLNIKMKQRNNPKVIKEEFPTVNPVGNPNMGTKYFGFQEASNSGAPKESGERFFNRRPNPADCPGSRTNETKLFNRNGGSSLAQFEAPNAETKNFSTKIFSSSYFYQNGSECFWGQCQEAKVERNFYQEIEPDAPTMEDSRQAQTEGGDDDIAAWSQPFEIPPSFSIKKEKNDTRGDVPQNKYLVEKLIMPGKPSKPPLQPNQYYPKQIPLGRKQATAIPHCNQVHGDAIPTQRHSHAQGENYRIPKSEPDNFQRRRSEDPPKPSNRKSRIFLKYNEKNNHCENGPRLSGYNKDGARSQPKAFPDDIEPSRNSQKEFKPRVSDLHREDLRYLRQKSFDQRTSFNNNPCRQEETNIPSANRTLNPELFQRGSCQRGPLDQELNGRFQRYPNRDETFTDSSRESKWFHGSNPNGFGMNNYCNQGSSLNDILQQNAYKVIQSIAQNGRVFSKYSEKNASSEDNLLEESSALMNYNYSQKQSERQTFHHVFKDSNMESTNMMSNQHTDDMIPQVESVPPFIHKPLPNQIQERESVLAQLDLENSANAKNTNTPDICLRSESTPMAVDEVSAASSELSMQNREISGSNVEKTNTRSICSRSEQEDATPTPMTVDNISVFSSEFSKQLKEIINAQLTSLLGINSKDSEANSATSKMNSIPSIVKEICSRLQSQSKAKTKKINERSKNGCQKANSALGAKSKQQHDQSLVNTYLKKRPGFSDTVSKNPNPAKRYKPWAAEQQQIIVLSSPEVTEIIQSENMEPEIIEDILPQEASEDLPSTSGSSSAKSRANNIANKIYDRLSRGQPKSIANPGFIANKENHDPTVEDPIDGEALSPSIDPPLTTNNRSRSSTRIAAKNRNPILGQKDLLPVNDLSTPTRKSLRSSRDTDSPDESRSRDSPIMILPNEYKTFVSSLQNRTELDFPKELKTLLEMLIPPVKVKAFENYRARNYKAMKFSNCFLNQIYKKWLQASSGHVPSPTSNQDLSTGPKPRNPRPVKPLPRKKRFKGRKKKLTKGAKRLSTFREPDHFADNIAPNNPNVTLVQLPLIAETDNSDQDVLILMDKEPGPSLII